MPLLIAFTAFLFKIFSLPKFLLCYYNCFLGYSTLLSNEPFWECDTILSKLDLQRPPCNVHIFLYIHAWVPHTHTHMPSNVQHAFIIKLSLLWFQNVFLSQTFFFFFSSFIKTMYLPPWVFISQFLDFLIFFIPLAPETDTGLGRS